MFSDLTSDEATLVGTRALRGFADGFASIVLVAHLSRLGLEPAAIGLVVTSTLLGSAALTLLVGFLSPRFAARSVLLVSAGLMIATGLGFALASGFWPILLVAFAGTLNPSLGDVTLFLPTEQTLIARSTTVERRTAVFARYNMAGSLLGSIGALASGLPEWAARSGVVRETIALRLAFVVYAAIAVVCAMMYRRLSVGRSPLPAADARRPLSRARKTVWKLAALFGIDAFAGGFVVQSMMALWLFRRFDVSLSTAGAFFFGTGALSAFSQLASAPLARRIGFVRTMAFTHIPANCFLVLSAFMPTIELAMACLLLRMATAAMDVPARQALVMSLVPEDEQPAAASVTNVPRSLAAALAPSFASAFLDDAWLGGPLVLGGALKIAYDLLLLAQFREDRAR